MQISQSRLAAFIAERVPDELPAAEVRAEELALVCGCADGDLAALAAFSSTYEPHVAAILKRCTRIGTIREDARRELAAHLFVALPNGAPRITGYRGRGPLLAFVRVAAIRLALGLIRAGAGLEHESLDEELADAAIDPELLVMKEIYREEFKQSFAAAMGKLAPRDLTLLRHQIVDGLSIDRIGVIYGIHRATAARQLADARKHLAETTQAELKARLKLEPSEVDSIIRLVLSQIDISVKRLLSELAS